MMQMQRHSAQALQFLATAADLRVRMETFKGAVLYVSLYCVTVHL